jgi:hypothetical protein
MDGVEPAGLDRSGDTLPGIGRYALGLVIGFALVLAATLCLPFDRYLASQQARDSEMFHARWIYERIHFDPAPIDVAIIGSSRVEAGISPSIMTQALSQKLGRPVHAVSLAMVRPGRDYHALLVRDLVRYHPEVKLIILSDDGFMPLSHPLFQEMAVRTDVVSQPLLINRNYFKNLFALPYRNLLNAAEQVRPGWFAVDKTFDPSRYAGSDLDRTLGYRLPDGHWRNGDSVMPVDQLKLRAERTRAIGQSRQFVHLPFLPEAWRLAIEYRNMASIGKLADRHHIMLAFVGLPMFGPYDEPRNPAFLTRYGPDIMLTSLRNNPVFYQDDVHLNRAGAIVATRDLADQVAPLLAKESPDERARHNRRGCSARSPAGGFCDHPYRTGRPAGNMAGCGRRA